MRTNHYFIIVDLERTSLKILLNNELSKQYSIHHETTESSLAVAKNLEQNPYATMNTAQRNKKIPEITKTVVPKFL